MTHSPQDFTRRADAERALDAIISIAAVDLRLSGRAYLHAIVEQIARYLEVAFVFVGRTCPDNPAQVETLELWADGRFAANFTYDLDGTPCEGVLSGKRVCIYTDDVAAQFPADVLLVEMGVRSYAGAPLLLPNGRRSGLLVALDTKPCADPDFTHLVLDFFASRAAAELERQHAEDALRDALADLERRFQDRERALAAAQSQLIELARRSGMADIATSILHNIGNLLTAAETSAAEIQRLSRSRTLDIWRKASGLLASHAHDLPAFFQDDPRGRRLPSLFQEAARVMDDEAACLSNEAQTLHRSLTLIAAVIQDQQAYARGDDTLATLDAAQVVAEVVAMFAHRLTRHEVEVCCDLPPLPVRAAKVKLFQIMSNLLRNAIDFVQGQPVRQITISSPAPCTLQLSDSGPGVSPEDQPKLFSLGFSTRPQGNGIGLHSAAVLASEMGARLSFAGNHPGATFRIAFAPPAPYTNKPTARADALNL
jgi:signal transduction histidine kinase